MDSFEINKMLGAVLGMLTLAMGLGFLSGAFVHSRPPVQAGYALPEPQAQSAAAAAPAVAEEPIAVRLASADVGKGEAASKKCVSCHSFTPDMKNGTGPGLYNVVGREKASVAGFNYSNAMKEAKSKGPWSFEALDAFVHNPKAYVPNTAMNYNGIPRPDERANLIAYLRTLSPSPVPLPTP